MEDKDTSLPPYTPFNPKVYTGNSTFQLEVLDSIGRICDEKNFEMKTGLTILTINGISILIHPNGSFEVLGKIK